MVRIRWAMEAAAVYLLTLLLRVLPQRAGLKIGASVGALFFAVDRRHSSVALENLAMAYPDRDEDWRRGIAKASFKHLGRLLVELCLQGCKCKDPMRRVQIEGWEVVQRVHREGKGYFLVSAHFGNWEKVAFMQGALGHPLRMITRPLDNPYLESFLKKRREASGNSVVYKRNSTREMVKSLKRGQGIAILIDQNFGEDGAFFVPFFGRLAATTPVLGRLWSRMGVPVVTVFSYPDESGGYRVVYELFEMRNAGEGDEGEALEMTKAVTAKVESAIRRSPNAWFWMHRRWRTRPANGADGE